MILIADSGSTKCDWIAINTSGEVLGEFSTQGLNPYFHKEDLIEEALLVNKKLMGISSEVVKIFFYGAGASSAELVKVMTDGLARIFKTAQIVVDHDLVGAAYAAYDGEENITCIMGTGSNSCFFDGTEVSEEIPSLAYILGDEASGSYFGKMLLRAFFYKKLPKHLHESFEKTYQLEKDEFIQRVYNQPHANVYLASFMKFLGQHKEEALFQEWVEEGIREFIQIHVKCFKKWEQVPVHFIGSIGYYFESALRVACEKEGLKTGRIIKKPIHSLVQYHLDHLIHLKQA